jgi:penicillin V acylase-like amidase (Ntn superfamily)
MFTFSKNHYFLKKFQVICYTLCLCILSSLLPNYQSLACTSAYHTQSHLMIKSYDWHDRAGYLYWNPKGTQRSALLQRLKVIQPHQWQSKWDNLTFNQYGQGFPNGGMNEKGLTIEVLWLDDNEPAKPKTATYISELEWVQYYLDTASTVQEVIDHITQIDLAIIQGKVHYFMCDASQQCASIEWIKGKLKVHSQEAMPYPTLTNHSYQQSQAFCNRYLNPYSKDQKTSSHLKPLKKIPTSNKSLSRFTRTAHWTHSMILNQDPIAYAFDYLDSVKYPEYTQWQIVYDIRRLKVYFKTSHHAKIRTISLPNVQTSWRKKTNTVHQEKEKEKEKQIRINATKKGCPAHWGYGLQNKKAGEISHLFYFLDQNKAKKYLAQRMKKQKIPTQMLKHIFRHQSSCTLSP